MGDENAENDGGIGSVKAAISRYGGQVNPNTGLRIKTQKNASGSEVKGSQAPELHIARKTFDKFNEHRKIAETVASQAELELRQAKIIARDLRLQIEELKLKASDKRSVQKTVQVENHQHLTMVRETEILRQEVSKMKHDIKRALEGKTRAENEINAAGLRLDSYVKTVEKLRREIDEANEEEVIVELARIEACKELAVIDAQKKEEAENFSSRIREVRKKINVLRKEVEHAKQFEDVLAITNSEAVELQKELNFIKDMESSKNSLSKNSELLSVKDELEAARKEQSSMKAKVFQIMTSMELIRIEINNLLDEKDQIKKEESATEKYINKLNSKLIRGKDELKAAKASAEKAGLMLPSLTLSLSGCAKGAKDVADKKMAAAHAWEEALRANVKEMQIRTTLAKNEIKELKMKEERELNDLEMRKKRDQENTRPRLMIESSYSLTPVRQVKTRKSGGSMAARRPIISTFWTVERKKKAMGKNGNSFAKEKSENEKTG